MKQKTLDRIRVLNKRFTNRIMVHLAGKKWTTFGVLGHTGRKTGRHYRIPIIARLFKNGFVIALTYGKKVDWYENIKASGTGSLFWKGKEYNLVAPELVDPEIGITAFPKLLQGILRKMGIEYYLKLDIE